MKLDQELARALYDRKVGLIESLGVFALKTILTLNSGATVVLLALLGNLQDNPKGLQADLSQLQWAMTMFLCGIVAVMVAIAITYVVAQLDVLRWPQGLRLPAAVHMGFMIVPAGIGFIAFCYGFVQATYAFS